MEGMGVESSDAAQKSRSGNALGKAGRKQEEHFLRRPGL